MKPKNFIVPLAIASTATLVVGAISFVNLRNATTPDQSSAQVQPNIRNYTYKVAAVCPNDSARPNTIPQSTRLNTFSRRVYYDDYGWTTVLSGNSVQQTIGSPLIYDKFHVRIQYKFDNDPRPALEKYLTTFAAPLPARFILRNAIDGDPVIEWDHRVAANTPQNPYVISANLPKEARECGGSGIPSVPVPTSTPTVGAYVRVAASDDTEAQRGYPKNPHGTQTTMEVDRDASGSDKEAYVKFNLGKNPYIGQIKYTKAILNIYVTDGSVNGPELYRVNNNFLNTTTPWIQSTLTWNNKPAKIGASLENKGAIAANTWVKYDVTGVLGSSTDVNRIFSFGLFADSEDGAKFATREAGNATLPILEYWYIPPAK